MVLCMNVKRTGRTTGWLFIKRSVNRGDGRSRTSQVAARCYCVSALTRPQNESQKPYSRLVNDDEWQALEQRVSQREGVRGRPWSSRYLLTGMLKCAWCKTPDDRPSGSTVHQPHDGQTRVLP